MSNPEILLTRINLHSINAVSVRGSGEAGLSRHDIMAALGMGNLPHHCYWLAMAFYTHDNSRVDELGQYAWETALHLAKYYRWEDPPQTSDVPYIYRSLARVALWEILTQHERHCRLCNGDGKRPHDVAPSRLEHVSKSTCPRCFGTGMRELSETNRALRCGIPATSWRRHWQTRYQAIRLECESWLRKALAHVRRYTAEEGYWEHGFCVE